LKTGTTPYSYLYPTHEEGPDPNPPTYGRKEGAMTEGVFVERFGRSPIATSTRRSLCVNSTSLRRHSRRCNRSSCLVTCSCTVSTDSWTHSDTLGHTRQMWRWQRCMPFSSVRWHSS